MDQDTSTGGGDRSQSSSSMQRQGGDLGDTASSRPPLSQQEREERKKRKKERMSEDPAKFRRDKAERKKANDDAAMKKKEEAEKRLRDEVERKMKEEEAEKNMLQDDGERKMRRDESVTMSKPNLNEGARGSGQQGKPRNKRTMTLGQFHHMIQIEKDFELFNLDSEPSRSQIHGGAEVEGDEEDGAVDTDEHYALLFGEFLTEAIREDDGNEGSKSYYPSLVPGMKFLGSYTLKVDFLDLLVKRKYKDLVIRIGKDDHHGWLHSAVAHFLHKNGMGDETEDSLKMKVSLSFTNKIRLQNLDTFMNSKDRWAVRPDKKLPLTAHGEQAFTSVIRHVVSKHIQNLTYSGDFTKDDILLGKGFCHIYSQCSEKLSFLSFRLDFSNTWEVMSPYYVVEIKDDAKKYPHNFAELMDTLTFNDISLSEATTEAYRDFASYHTTLASSEALRYLTMEMRRIVKDHPELLNESFLSHVPTDRWMCWGARRKCGFDWREAVEDSQDPVEYGVYWFDLDRDDSTSAKGQHAPSSVTKLSNKGVSTSGKGQQAPSASVTKLSTGSGQKKDVSIGAKVGQQAPLPSVTKLSIGSGQKKDVSTGGKGDQHAPSPSVTKPSTGSEQSTASDTNARHTGRKRYKNTVWGMLDHRRCIIEHGKKHANYTYSVEGSNWTELHASQLQPNIMPYLVYTMLKNKIFSDRRFGALWEKFKSLYPVEDKQ